MSERSGHLFDREADVVVTAEHLPHWAQSATITFVTMRLADSIPREVIERWNRERIDFLRRHKIECAGDWKMGRSQLDEKAGRVFDREFSRALEMQLDDCLGNCELRNPLAAEIVAGSLLKFDDDRYLMGDFVIMPNHAHCLVAIFDPTRLRKQIGEWMRFSARKINSRINRTGELWYEEPFDHLVRSESQLSYLRDYIAANPLKANLTEGDFLYRRSKRSF